MPGTPRSHLSFPPDILVKAQGAGAGIKAAIFDVDGVLTDGTIWTYYLICYFIDFSK